MQTYAYYNGKFGKKEDINISLNERSIYFGDAIYDAAVGRCDRIMWENEHIDRFYANAAKIGITIPMNKNDFSALLHEVAIKSTLENYFLYFQASRCSTERTHSYIGSSTGLMITVSPYKIKRSQAPLNLITFKDMRHGYCDIKTVNLLPSVLASTEAKRQGCDEAIFVRRGTVTECAKSNIAIINQGRVITHPKGNRILPGITREHLALACKEIGVPFIEKRFTVNDMMKADEVIITSTTNLCKRIGRINGISVGESESSVSKALSELLYKEYKRL